MEQRLEAEQAARAEEDARLRELYPLPEDEEDFQEEQLSDINSEEIEIASSQSDIEEPTQESSNSEDVTITKEEGTR